MKNTRNRNEQIALLSDTNREKLGDERMGSETKDAHSQSTDKRNHVEDYQKEKQ